MPNLAYFKAIVKLNNSLLVQKSYSSQYNNFILYLYIAYELNDWPDNSTNNFTLKNCLLGTVKLTGNADKIKFTCNCRRIALDGKGLLNFGNGFGRNVVIFVSIIPHHLILIIEKSNRRQ